MLGWFILVSAVLVGLYIVFAAPALSGLGGGELAYLIMGSALVALYIFSVGGSYKGRTARAVRHILTWCAVFLFLIGGYAYRAELTEVAARVSAELSPAGAVVQTEVGQNGARSVRLRRRMNGHFAANTLVNGANLTMLVDTGASTVVLKPADANKAGVDVSSLKYTVAVSTANGMTFAAPLRLKSISIGGIEIRDVEALIAQPGNLKESLLGMSFLKRLRSYEFSGDFLTLRG